MNKHWTILGTSGKSLIWAAILSTTALTACSTNPATGERQFAALMSPSQETQVGASEHQKIIEQFGLYNDQKINNYVREVGQRISRDTERPDVQYQFFVLDSPIVNAFALPGGYVYISRGLLALANNEAEMAGVLAHEVGHITGRHSAERYSRSVVTSLGAAVISAAAGSDGLSQALGVGSNLYLSSYSRGQENEADSLGIRYLSRGGYDTRAMSSFLNSLHNQTNLDGQLAGRGEGSGFDYFSTHPATADRVSRTGSEAGQYQQGGDVNRDRYLDMINGMIYGDSPDQGFAKGQTFYHPKIGFAFDAPAGYQIINQPSQVVANSASTGSVIVFDMVGNQGVNDPAAFVANVWLKQQTTAQKVERMTVNGMPAAAAAFNGQVNGQPMTIRVMAVQWDAKSYARFQIATPQNASNAVVESTKRAAQSLRRLSDKEKAELKPDRLTLVTAGVNDTVASLARRMPFDTMQEQRFRVLNGLAPNENVRAGQKYKLVVAQ